MNSCSSIPDTARLDVLEKIIAEHQQGFLKTASALCEIRDFKLYKQRGYKTFDAYCLEKWNFGREQGRLLVRAARVVQSLPSEMQTLVCNEKQASALAQVMELERPQVIQSAITSGLTAETISEAAVEFVPGLTQQSYLERICKLFDRLGKVQGSPEASMVKSANLIREIGLHLECPELCGRGVNKSKFLKVRKQLPKALDLKKCRLCGKVAKHLKDKATKPEDMMRVSDDVMHVRGVSSGVRHRETQKARELSPMTAIYAALSNARSLVEMQLARRNEWSERQEAGVKDQVGKFDAWWKTVVSTFY
jgi:hypothetical protein